MGEIIPFAWDDSFGKQGLPTVNVPSATKNNTANSYVSPKSPLASEKLPKDASALKSEGKDQIFSDGNSYTIWVEVFENGSAILDAYEKKQPNPKDIHFFCESTDPKKNNLFGTFVLVKYGTEYRNLVFDLKQKSTTIASKRKNELEATLIKSFEDEVDDNVSIIKKYLNVNVTSDKIKYAMEGELYVSDTNKKTLNDIYSWYNDGVTAVVEKIIGWMESAKFTPDDYQPKAKPTVSETAQRIVDSVTGYLFPDVITNFISSSFEAAFSAIRQLSKKALPQTLIDFLGRVYGKLQQGLDAFKPILQDISKAAEGAYSLRAFVMGFLNGLNSTLQMIVSLCGWVLKTHQNDAVNGQLWRKINSYAEFIEDTFDLISEKFSDFASAIMNLVKDFSIEKLESIFSFFTDKLSGNNRYDYAYFAGSFIFEVVLGVVLAFLTGGATAVLKAASSAEKFAALVKLVLQEAISTATGGILDILALLKALITRFIKACAKGWEGLKDFFEEFFSAAKKEIDENEPGVDDVELPNATVIAEGAGAKNYRTKNKILDHLGSFKNLRRYEDEIRHETNEFARFFDDAGNEVSPPLTSNKADSVEIDPYDFIEYKRQANGNLVLTHNHPKGSSLSYHDIEIFVRHDLKELRAVTPENQIYALQRTGKLPKRSVFDNEIIPKVQNKIRSKNKKFFQIFDELTKTEKLRPAHLRSRTWKESNQRVIELYSDGLLYELREVLKYVKYK